jgi:tetratricopeptide (TPR) repeat protein
VRILLAGLLGALLAATLPADGADPAVPAVELSARTGQAEDPLEKEYQQLLTADDKAREELDEWLLAERKSGGGGTNASGAEWRARIRERLEPVRKSYEVFLQRHPDHARARVAFGSFLSDLGDEEGAGRQWELARDLDARLPAVWNNLANYYVRKDDLKRAFQCFDKAIQLNPRESLYHQNLAVTMYLFRRAAQEHYDLDGPQMFNRVMALYQKALALDPQNFLLAAELAQIYYGFRPGPADDPQEARRAEQSHYDDALGAWQRALKLADDDLERQGVHLHLARLNLMAGRFDEARRHLGLVTLDLYGGVKERLQQSLLHRDTQVLTSPPLTLRPLPGAETAPGFRPATGRTNSLK